MSDLSDLYNDLVIDHSSKPRNFRPMPEADRHLEGHNPLCGDRLTVYLKMDGDIVKDISFHSHHKNCAFSTASASMMTQLLKGKPRSEAESLFEKFRAYVTGKVSAKDAPELGKLIPAFAALTEKPLRVKCATLPWHTFRSALVGEDNPVSTE